MESVGEVPSNVVGFHPNTLQEVRKLYNLDQPGRIDETINILEEWIQKQDHFMKKDFSRDLLERIIIVNKGQLERVKRNFDTLCTKRTLLPQYFVVDKVKDYEELHFIYDFALPKLTPDNHRIYLMYYNFYPDERPEARVWKMYHRKTIIALEFLQRFDYNSGYIAIIDARRLNYLNILTTANPIETSEFMDILVSEFIMEILKENRIFKFHPDTLEAVRKSYDLDKPGRIEEAVTLLEEWIKKQEHFSKKEFDKSFLEKILIFNKGRIERTKQRLDKLFTIRTLMPQFFGAHSFKDDPEDMILSYDIVLPKMTPDYYRVTISKRTKTKTTAENFLNNVRRTVSFALYDLNHDYCNGYIIVNDSMDWSISDLMADLNLDQFRQGVSILMDGFATRVKGIHILNQSPLIDTVLSLAKLIIPKKLADRITIHTSIESLAEVLPKEILPVEYGGSERPFMEIYEDLIDELSSKEHLDFVKNVCEVTVDESRRLDGKFNEEYLGMPGSFRSLNVD